MLHLLFDNNWKLFSAALSSLSVKDSRKTFPFSKWGIHIRKRGAFYLWCQRSAKLRKFALRLPLMPSAMLLYFKSSWLKNQIETQNLHLHLNSKLKWVKFVAADACWKQSQQHLITQLFENRIKSFKIFEIRGGPQLEGVCQIWKFEWNRRGTESKKREKWGEKRNKINAAATGNRTLNPSIRLFWQIRSTWRYSLDTDLTKSAHSQTRNNPVPTTTT